MPYTLQYENEGYIKLVYDGDAKIEDAKDILIRGAALAQKHNCFRLFSDFRTMKLNLSISSLYLVAEMQMELSNKMHIPFYKFKRAMVAPEEGYGLYKFFETVAVNRMHKVKIFTDYEEALQWLFEN